MCPCSPRRHFAASLPFAQLAIIVLLAAIVSLAGSVTAAEASVPATAKGYVWVKGTGPRPSYKWSQQGWQEGRLTGGRRVWTQPFSAPWMWLWTGSSWHAMDRSQLSATRPGATASATTATGVTLLSPATDNYKASFNANPAQPELRTWLSFSGLRYKGVRYNAVAGQPLFAGRLRLKSRDGRTLTARLGTSSSNAAALQFRTGPQAGFTGVFLQLRSRAALKRQPVSMRIVLLDGQGRSIARLGLQYRYGVTLATAPAGSLEHNGPGGRWFVAGRRTPTNVEIGRQ